MMSLNYLVSIFLEIWIWMEKWKHCAIASHDWRENTNECHLLNSRDALSSAQNDCSRAKQKVSEQQHKTPEIWDEISSDERANEFSGENSANINCEKKATSFSDSSTKHNKTVKKIRNLKNFKLKFRVILNSEKMKSWSKHSTIKIPFCGILLSN